MALADDVDLPPSLACLKTMDTLLRCPICYDFLSISMMSQCSHNFCSLCIRKFLSYKLQCPVCNLPMTEQDLRNNRIIDDLVKSFQDARKRLSQVQFDSPPISPKTPSSVLKRKAQPHPPQQQPPPPPQQQQQQQQPQPRRGPRRAGSLLSHFFSQKQPCAASSSASGPGGEPEALPPRDKRARTASLRTATLTVKQEPLDEEEEEEVVPPVTQREQATAVGEEVQRPSTSTKVHVKEEKTDHELCSPSTSLDITPVVKVECPVCEVPVAQQHINKHLDTCLRSGEKKEALRSSGRRKPMAKVVYHLLSVRELKRRLFACCLSTQGSREQMVRRHQDFLLIYNAECDSHEPRPVEDIAKEVESNEKMRMQMGKKNKAAMVFRKDQSEEEIEAVHSNYRKQHSKEFSRLVAQVKGRMETSKRPRQIKQETEAVGEETSCEANTTEAVPACEKLDTDTNSLLPEVMPRSPSPSPSEVSISSSISDVFS